MKCILFRRADGVTRETYDPSHGWTDEQLDDRGAGRVIIDGFLDYLVCDMDDVIAEIKTEWDQVLPDTSGPNRYFRDAVVWDDTSPVRCKMDMSKAREIHMARIRKVRDVRLQELDVPFMRAVESGDSLEQARIAAQKQALRDLPTTFDLTSYDTTSSLKAAWPNEL